MYQVYLITYSHNCGAGRTFNYRTDGQTPSVDDIESIEKEISEGNGCSGVCVTGVYRLADSEKYYGEES